MATAIHVGGPLSQVRLAKGLSTLEAESEDKAWKPCLPGRWKGQLEFMGFVISDRRNFYPAFCSFL